MGHLLPGPGTLLVFAGACLLLAAIPGPAVLYIVTRSISQGRLAGALSAAGVAGGGLVHVAAAALGVSVLLASSALAFSLVKYAGAAYLVYIGIRRLLAGDDVMGAGPAPSSRRRLLTDGVVVNVLNPKTALFFYAFIPQFVDPSRGAGWAQTLVLGVIFVAISVVSDLGWAMATGTGARWLRRTRVARATRYVSGGVLIALGVVAALARPAQASAGAL